MNKKGYCLKKINAAARQIISTKKRLYEQHKHMECQEAKREASRLYLLKTLTLLDMGEKGESSEGELRYNGKRNTLHEWITNDGYVFHNPALRQGEGELTLINGTELKDETIFYRPCEYYLLKDLSQPYKDLYELFVRNKFQFDLHPKAKIFNLLGNLRKYHMTAHVATGGWYSMGWWRNGIDLYLQDNFLCRISIFIEEESEYDLGWEEDDYGITDSIVVIKIDQ